MFFFSERTDIAKSKFTMTTLHVLFNLIQSIVQYPTMYLQLDMAHIQISDLPFHD